MKKKVLFILHIPPPIHGSSMIGKFIKESNIINQNLDCTYINLGTSFSLSEIGQFQLKKILVYLNIVFKITNKILFHKYDLVYIAITAKGPAFYKDSLIAIILKIFNNKIIYHFHNKGVSTRQDKLLDNLLYKLTFNNSYVILLSPLLYPDIAKYVSKERVMYCPNGIPLNNKIALKKNKSAKVEILFLSNLIESKGLFVLLDACKVLVMKCISYHCTIIGAEGDITEQNLNTKINEMGLNLEVSYLGKKYGTEKDEIFAASDIFVFPTYNETFGLVNLEAMQHSLPIISTYEGAIPDIIEDGVTGFLVNQRNSNQLAEKLEILINDSYLRESMGAAGNQRYHTKFTLEIFEKRLNEILNNVVNI